MKKIQRSKIPPPLHAPAQAGAQPPDLMAQLQQARERCVELDWRATKLSKQREEALNKLADAEVQLEFASQHVAMMQKRDAEHVAEIERLTKAVAESASGAN